MVLGCVLGLVSTVNLMLSLMKWLNPLAFVLGGVKKVLQVMVLLFIIAGIIGVVLVAWAYFQDSIRQMCPLRGMRRRAGREPGARIPIE